MHSRMVLLIAPQARDPDTFMWEFSGNRYEFTRRCGAEAGYQVRCGFHEPMVGLRGNSSALLRCSRQMSNQALKNAQPEYSDAELEQGVVAQLKYWAAQSTDAGSRSEHMDVHLFPRTYPKAGLPTDAQYVALEGAAVAKQQARARASQA